MNNYDGAGPLTLVGQTIAAGITSHRQAKARNALRDLAKAAALAQQREEERRQAWLAAVIAQTKEMQAGDGTMQDIHAAQNNPLDKQKFVVPIPKSESGATPFVFGLELDREAGAVRENPVYVDDVLPIVLIGRMGAGKSTREFTPFFMRARQQSMVIFCCKGTAPEQTYAERAKFSDCSAIDPCGVLSRFGSKIKTTGFNPIARLDPDSPEFRSDCIAISEAIHDPEQGVGQHFRSGSVAYGALHIGEVVVKARREGRIPYFPNVRTMTCAPDEWQEFTDAAGKPARRLIGGASHTLRQIVKSGHPALADMASKFMREHGGNELAGVMNTFETQSRFLHDPLIKQCMRGMGADLTRLCDGDQPSTIFVTIEPGNLSEFNRLVRLVVTVGLRSHFRVGKYKTVFVLDEFRATVATLPIIRDLWSVMREYRAQFIACVTSMTQFSKVWGEEWENMIGQCGAIALLGSAPDPISAEWLSKRSGRKLIARFGYSENGGESSGNNSGSGFSQSIGGYNNNENAGRNAGLSNGGGYSVTQVEVPAVTPQELLSMRPGEGRVWYPGEGTRSVPFFAPHYWNRLADWVGRVGKNPYYKG